MNSRRFPLRQDFALNLSAKRRLCNTVGGRIVEGCAACCCAVPAARACAATTSRWQLSGVNFAGWRRPQIRGETMLPDTPSVTQLSQVITQITAPSFLLGAVAAFISVLVAAPSHV